METAKKSAVEACDFDRVWFYLICLQLLEIVHICSIK